MRIFLLALLSLSPLLPAAGTGAECAKTPDACGSRQESSTPFIAALKSAAAAKPAPAAEKPARTPSPAPAPKAAEKAPAAEPAAPPEKETFARPGWAAAAVLFLYGLYFFLKEGKKRKGRK